MLQHARTFATKKWLNVEIVKRLTFYFLICYLMFSFTTPIIVLSYYQHTLDYKHELKTWPQNPVHSAINLIFFNRIALGTALMGKKKKPPQMNQYCITSNTFITSTHRLTRINTETLLTCRQSFLLTICAVSVKLLKKHRCIWQKEKCCFEAVKCWCYWNKTINHCTILLGPSLAMFNFLYYCLHKEYFAHLRRNG